MMGTHATIEGARLWLCPLARTFAAIGEAADPYCRGDVCAAWRWATGTPFADAVNAAAVETGEAGTSAIRGKPKAAALVAADPVKYGVHGYCGIGGAP